MADEQNVQQQPTQKATADEVITVPAERRPDLPASASKDLTWKAAGQRIDYTATAAYLERGGYHVSLSHRDLALASVRAS